METNDISRELIEMFSKQDLTEEDINKHFKNKDKEKDAFEICLKKIQEHELTMKLIDVEYTFDNNKVIFKYHQAKYEEDKGRIFIKDIDENTCELEILRKKVQ